MSKPKKHRFIPKVCLKYFSASEDWLGLYVLVHFNLYKKRIQKVNAGDAILGKGILYNGLFR
ncbi:hypothetical protein [Pedobacter gandavensis]|uniref:Uncharacterized protein n=1 Tax=Pedobacter gandavensis TaxID=2679963 RepID=A0ABR6EQ60_9SPHI|nr:hypothetical protein [Pedobacter gandavensis]MBB2147377.1 hypothetical protein [Pedobacter gandavensis]